MPFARPPRPDRFADQPDPRDRLERLLVRRQRAAPEEAGAGDGAAPDPVDPWGDRSTDGAEQEAIAGSGLGVVRGEPLVRGGHWRPERAELEQRHDVRSAPGAAGAGGPVANSGQDGDVSGLVGGRHRGRVGTGDPAPRLLTVPASLRTAQTSVRPAAVVGMVLVLLLAAAVLGVRVWWAEQGAHPVALTSTPVGGAGPADQALATGGLARGDPPQTEAVGAGTDAAGVAVGAATTPAAEGAATPAAVSAAPTPERVVVHVSGQVVQPGIVELPAGGRVQDAVVAAGGLTTGADTARINLARPVQDGERVWVPQPGEEEPELVGPDPAAAGSVTGPASRAPSTGGGVATGATGPLIDLNTADQGLLEELPGVGPVTARAILDWREQHGRFTSAEELLEVSGIGERTLEQIRPHLAW